MESAPDILEELSLFVNDKTGYTRIYLAETNEKDEYGKKVRGNEEWIESLLLGSKLCSIRDILNRINKANRAFHTYANVWLNSAIQISEERKLKLNAALVTSVLLYNCSSWAAREYVFAKVDVHQRKHLKKILRIYWPNTISNQALCERCNVVPLNKKLK